MNLFASGNRHLLSFFITVLSACLFGLAWPAKASQPIDGRRVALVIGNSAYSENPLSNPVNDAKDMCKTLKELGFDAQCVYDIGDKRKFAEVVHAFSSKLDEKSVSLFYYAGHGMQIGGQNYLIPTQAALKSEVDVTWEAMDVQYVMDHLEKAKSQFSLAILDACRNNPWSRRWRSRGANMVDGLAAPPSQPRGSIIMYATRDREVASDGADGNGLFTKHLLANIRKRGLSVEQMIKQVSRGVEDESLRVVGRIQTPATYNQFTGEFCFAGCAPDSAKLLEQIAGLTKQLEQANQERQRNMVSVKNMASLEAERDALLKRVEQVQQQSVVGSKAQQKQLQEVLELQERIRFSEQKIKDNDMLARRIEAQASEIADLNRQIKGLNESLAGMARNSATPAAPAPSSRDYVIAAPM